MEFREEIRRFVRWMEGWMVRGGERGWVWLKVLGCEVEMLTSATYSSQQQGADAAGLD